MGSNCDQFYSRETGAFIRILPNNKCDYQETRGVKQHTFFRNVMLLFPLKKFPDTNTKYSIC